MKRISYWAQSHTRSAIILIVILKCTLAILACYLGLQLSQQGIHLWSGSVYLLAVLFMLAAAAYPAHRRQRRKPAREYARRKICDFVLIACSFLCISTQVNNLQSGRTNIQYGFGSFIGKKHMPTAEQILSSLEYRDKQSLTRQEKRILKKEFGRQLKIYAKSKLTGNKTDSSKSGLILLTIIGAIGLGLLLASLVCSLSCNGSETAAFLVGIFGIVGIVWGASALIRSIKRGPRTKAEPEPSQ